MNERSEVEVPLLPFGETLRPLLLTSSLTGFDLRFVLQKRGIFLNDAKREKTIPKLTSILLSPREFDILKNRQVYKDSTVKVSDAKTAWDSTKTLIQAIPTECEAFVQNLVDENSPYQITSCNVEVLNDEEIAINCGIKKQDWTKEPYSSISFHSCKLVMSKDISTNILTYRSETTVPETKDLISKLQTATHIHFQDNGDVHKDSKIQKVLANHFEKNAAIFEFLYRFINQEYTSLVFDKVTDIDVGIDQIDGQFPENFSWLKNNIDKINLHGRRLQSTDIMKLGELGILIFGEIEAEFKFSFPDARGTCIIRYGFPNFYEKRRFVEFEAKVILLTLSPSFAHASKEKTNRQIIEEFQKTKHQLFEQFVEEGKANTQKKNLQNQYEFDFDFA